MYRVTHFKKILTIDNSRPYGVIVVYFGSETTSKSTGRISLAKFMALSHLLENDSVGYNPTTKLFETNVEQSKFENPSIDRIS